MEEIIPAERVHDGRRVADHGLPRNEAGKADSHCYVKYGADGQRGDDADRQIALRVAALLGRRGDGIEADVREEDDGATGEHARPAVGHERMPVAGMDEADDGEDEDEDRNQLKSHHHIVGRGGLANAAHQDDRQDQDDEEGRNIEAEVPARMVEPVPG
jgi:hypothetical protein